MGYLFDPSNYALSPYALPLLIVGGMSAVLGLATLVRERASTVSIAFLLMIWAIDVWLLAFVAVYSTNDPRVALAWMKLDHIGIVLIPPMLFFFSTAVTQQLGSKWRAVAGVTAVAATFYGVFVPTGLLVVDVHHYAWGYYPVYGWPIVPFLLLFGALLGASMRMHLTSIAQSSSEVQRRRLKGIALALGIAYLASVDYLPALHVPIYPFGYVFIGAFTALAMRAIWRYRLVDITPAFAANEIVETMADALLVLDRDGVIRSANGAAAEMLGTSREKLTGMTAAELDATWFEGALGSLAMPEALHRSEVTYRKPDGDPGTALISASVVRDAHGDGQATVCIVHDISERKQAEEALRESEGLYRTLVETSPDAVLVVEQGGCILMANRRAAELVGLSNTEELRGRNAGDFVAPHDRQRLAESFQKASGPIILRDEEYMVVTNSGALLPAELSISRVNGTPGKQNAIMAVARDISERKRAEETIRYLAFHDALTGVANRSVLMEHLGKALAQARREEHLLALLFLDLDNFKLINDTVGHAAGDETLRRIAGDLLQIVREGDTLARMGGDEFVVLLARIKDTEEAIAVAKRILECLRSIRAAGGGDLPVTASIGIATYPADGYEAGGLLGSADTAMYDAKSRGGDSYQMALEQKTAPAVSRRAVR